MPQVSFARDIRPLFRDVDISHMEPHGIKLDDYTFMSDPDNANKVLETPAFHATRRALLDSGPARVVRPVAERGLPALSLDLGQRRGFVSKETNRKVSQFCLLDIVGLRCLRENRDAVVTRWRFRRIL